MLMVNAIAGNEVIRSRDFAVITLATSMEIECGDVVDKILKRSLKISDLKDFIFDNNFEFYKFSNVKNIKG